MSAESSTSTKELLRLGRFKLWGLSCAEVRAFGREQIWRHLHFQTSTKNMDQSTLTYHRHNYVQGPESTSLNFIDVWIPKKSASGSLEAGKWVIYIHGGAWRIENLGSFNPSRDILSASQRAIAGFAFISYRLSPLSSNEGDSSSSEDPAYQARHPDHVTDVSNALAFMEELYGISQGYVLVGHSCGATLAFQICKNWGNIAVPNPSCIIGSEGIYDLTELVTSFDISFYRNFVTSAFGSDRYAWRNASPTTFPGSASWQDVQAIIISHSEDDTLVDQKQADLMLKRIHGTSAFKGQVHYMAARGEHDDIWSKGSELARLIEAGLDMI